jgi:transcriptional regulator with XRE-family HTH domain
MKTAEITIDRKVIGKKFAAERDALKMSQSELAEKLGIDRRRVWQFESGTALTIEHIALLSKFYQKPIEFFLEK